jgi:glycosyltransferase involved in cell wall biosynthesis
LNKVFNMDNLPFVSLILPIRNEEKHIAETLHAILVQDYPSERMEILVVDGMSSDRTREVVREIAHSTPVPIQVLDNPRRIVPTAMNTGIRAARGEVIIRVDGHCRLPEDYVRVCVQALEETGADNVGGMQHPVGTTYIQKAIALATSSPLFIGNSYFRFAEEEREVDTVYLGAYPREVFDRIGLFDQELVRHQDYELNARLRNAGGTIRYLPRLKVAYTPRGSLSAFARQYFQYGMWKVRVMQKTAQAFRPRHFAPTLFSLGVLAGIPLSLIFPWFAVLYGLGWAAYVALCLGASLYVAARNRGWKYLPALVILFPTIHLGWGSGFWWGVLRWNMLERRSPARQERNAAQ